MIPQPMSGEIDVSSDSSKRPCLGHFILYYYDSKIYDVVSTLIFVLFLPPSFRSCVQARVLFCHHGIWRFRLRWETMETHILGVLFSCRRRYYCANWILLLDYL
jgi:hypothetical protein